MTTLKDLLHDFGKEVERAIVENNGEAIDEVEMEMLIDTAVNEIVERLIG